jgi:2-oxoglutarate dehydrogenase E1 component
MFENYLHTKFLGAKRFSVEGGESSILALQEIVRLCASNSIEEMVIGMAHRGRLSTLSQVLHKPYSNIFAGFMGYAINSELPSFVGDVKYHLGYDHYVEVDDKNVHISLTYNPSHLESVTSVVMGIVKAKQDLKDDQDKVIPVLIHGDASFAGQGRANPLPPSVHLKTKHESVARWHNRAKIQIAARAGSKVQALQKAFQVEA